VTIHVTATLRCDIAHAPDCHREYSTTGVNTAAIEFAVASESQAAGWRKVWTLAVETDICPACLAGQPPNLSVPVNQTRLLRLAAPLPASYQEGERFRLEA
jgi:hypothetical protein